MEKTYDTLIANRLPHAGLSLSVSLSLQVLGWVSLIAVAGVSFYFAKQSINERRRQQDIAGERPSARLDCERCDI